MQVSTGGAFRTVSTGRTGQRRTAAGRVVPDNSVDPPVVILQGRRDHQALFRQRGGTWTLIYLTNPYSPTRARRADS